MTALRNKYIRDLAIRGKAKRTQEAYTSFVADLARHYHRSPDLLSYDEVADWLFHLIRERKLRKQRFNANAESQAILVLRRSCACQPEQRQSEKSSPVHRVCYSTNAEIHKV